MQSKTSLWNKALFRNFSSVILFLTIINLICTFILVPFSYIMMYLDGSTTVHFSKYFVGIPEMTLLYFFGSMVYSVLCGVFITYFLKNEAASDFVHSLPVKRNTILTTMYATFLVHGFINVLINGMITLLLGFKFASIDIEKLLFWMIVSVGIYFICFTFTIMMSLFINNLMSHLVLTFVVALSPYILGTLMYLTQSFNFIGLNHFPQEMITYLTIPVQFLDDVSNEKTNLLYWFIVFILSILVTALNYYLYKIRKNERIHEAYSNYIVQFVFYLVTMLMATLFGGMIFSGLVTEHKWLMIFIYIVAFTIIYVFLEMLAQKSVRITFHRRLYAITFVFVAVGILFTFITGQMRESYIPKTEQVSAVKTDIHQTIVNDKESLLNVVSITDPKYIDNMTRVHQYLLTHHRENGENYFNITYHLKNGRDIKRQYTVQEHDAVKIKKIANQGVKKENIIGKIKWNELSKLDIGIMENSSDQEVQSLSKSQINALIPELKKSFMNALDANKYFETASGRYYININDTEKSLISTTSSSYGITMNLYEQDILKAYNKIGIKKQPSDFLPKGKVYLIGKKKDYDAAVDSNDILETFNAKKQDRKNFENKFNTYGASTDGNYLYFIDSEGGPTLLLMTN